MSEPMLKMKALIKAQSALTRIELRAKGTQATYLAVALVFARQSTDLQRDFGKEKGTSPKGGGQTRNQEG